MTNYDGVVSVDALMRGAVIEFQLDGKDYFIEYDLAQEEYDLNIFVVTEVESGRVWEIDGCPAAFDYITDNKLYYKGKIFSTPIPKQHNNQMNYYDR